VKRNNFWLILVLGALTALCPFSIDMYLPAFLKIAAEFKIPSAAMSLTLSGFFVGLATGQLFYGPLLDRFGRKRPLYAGLSLYILASIGCWNAHSLQTLVLFRFIQALGGCGASVAAMAMVRDFFSGKEIAKVFTLLILILGVSPLLAPTVGGYLATWFGWKSIFMMLAAICAAMLAAVRFYLPEGHAPDPTHSLRPGPILRGYLEILKEPQFYTHALAASLALSGLFVYLASSPMIFMEIFRVTPQVYGWIFGILAMGFVGASQLNFLLLRKFSNEEVLWTGLIGLTVIGILFVIAALQGWFGLTGTMILLFLFLAFFGIANPNASALALTPFTRNAGSASAMLGFLQMVIGAIASIGISLLNIHHITPIAAMFAVSGILALIVMRLGTHRIIKNPIQTHEPSAIDTLI